ncbi:AAA family ATPase [Endozoicomonas sp.]|uniref:AAA family ATPase n=1 Tax=Endozoicomonas sp. TaxID=1892382 RepID=UPI003AF4D379
MTPALDFLGVLPNRDSNAISGFERALRSLETPVFTRSPPTWLGRTVKCVAYAGAFIIGVGLSKSLVIGLCALAITDLAITAITNRFITQPPIKTLRSIQQQYQRAAQATENPDPLRRLEEMVGMDEVAEQVKGIRSKIIVDNKRRQLGLVTTSSSSHMVFTGNPGTGKTETARIMAEILFELGIIRKNKVVYADRTTLVSPWIGATGLKTEQVIKSAIGGVLFIDEAYALIRETDDKGAATGRDTGKEAIEKLLLMMEKHKGELVVVFAGYPDEMKTMLTANPGLQSRIQHTVKFKDYTNDELASIFRGFCNKSDYTLSEEAFSALKEKISQMKELCEKRTFGNARAIRNLLDKVITTQSKRLTELTPCATFRFA